VSLGFVERAARLRTAFLAARRGDLFLERVDLFREDDALAFREDDALARLVTARLRPFVLFFARRLTLRRARFAMMKNPFKSLTGFR
jgi:hypothetical protein